MRIVCCGHPRSDGSSWPSSRRLSRSAANSPPWPANWPTCGIGSAAARATPPSLPPATALGFSHRGGARAGAASGTLLQGEDPAPVRHQVLEIPAITLLVNVHRLHRRVCPCCSTSTCALLPADGEASRFGPRLSALVGLLSSTFPLSFSKTQVLINQLLGVEMSRGASATISAPHGRSANDAACGGAGTYNAPFALERLEAFASEFGPALPRPVAQRGQDHPAHHRGPARSGACPARRALSSAGAVAGRGAGRSSVCGADDAISQETVKLRQRHGPLPGPHPGQPQPPRFPIDSGWCFASVHAVSAC